MVVCATLGGCGGSTGATDQTVANHRVPCGLGSPSLNRAAGTKITVICRNGKRPQETEKHLEKRLQRDSEQLERELHSKPKAPVKTCAQLRKQVEPERRKGSLFTCSMNHGEPMGIYGHPVRRKPHHGKFTGSFYGE